jgi:hypothetical protein
VYPRVETPIAVGTGYHLIGGFSAGRGIRFNNPYRLERELGGDAQSLSLTATYLDVNLGLMLGGARSIFHGAAVHGSFATEGVAQEVVTPAYALLLRPHPRWGIQGYAGIPIVIQPDLNAGLEVGVGGMFYMTAALGVIVSAVGSLFYGAATLETSRSAIPLLSFEGGLFYDYEILP